MAQTIGEGFNQGKGPGAWGGGRNPYTRPKVKPAPVPHSYAPRPPSNPYRNTGGGGGRGGGTSGGVGSNSSGRISNKAPAPPAKPAAPAVSPAEAERRYLLTDTAYKAQNDALTKALSDYQIQKASQENQYGTQYTTNVGELGKQEKLDLGNTEADYAARGMGFGSGSSIKALADLRNQYDAREAQLLADKTNYLGNLGSAYTNFQGEQGINRARYKQEALARRAAQLGQ